VVPALRLAVALVQVNSVFQALTRKLFGLRRELELVQGLEPPFASLRSPVSEVQEPSGHL
jgi:hypothetical protein